MTVLFADKSNDLSCLLFNAIKCLHQGHWHNTSLSMYTCLFICGLEKEKNLWVHVLLLFQAERHSPLSKQLKINYEEIFSLFS